jgi:hypothetical protein
MPSSTFDKVAWECVDTGVAVDMFLFLHSYIDLASKLARFPLLLAASSSATPCHVQG